MLRPQPGAEATAARAEALGFTAIVAPLFTLAPVAWDAPDPTGHDALMLTSAAAVRHAGPALARYRTLPVYAVGAATAQAARDAGFGDVFAGAGDAYALAALMTQDGIAHPLHLCGREHRAPRASFPIARRIVYAADPVDRLPPQIPPALAAGAIALLHSPRAAATFAALLAQAGLSPETVSVVAISSTAAHGTWRDAAIAASPDDAGLLAAAVGLCEKG